MSRTQVWLARHGETEWSASGQHTGLTDIPLSDNGRAAASLLRGILADEEFDLVLTSPSQRALETCSLAGFGDGAVQDPSLHEWDYGEYEGVTTEEIRQTRPGWNVFADGCPNGESLADVAGRADAVIERLHATDGRVLVFGHGHALRVLGARWIDADPAVGANLVLDTATVSVLGWDRDQPAITRWNAPC